MFKEMNKAYSLMEDDHSKDIFRNRALYNITGDYTYIDNVVSIYFERMQRDFLGRTDIITNLRGQIGNRKVVIYGIGECGLVTLALFTSALKDVELAAFCDRHAVDISDFHGYRVIDIEELTANYKDVVVIVTPVWEKYKSEIISDLISRGFDTDQIIERVPFNDYDFRGEYFCDVVQLGKDEVFVDAGCLNCGTALEFAEKCPDYKEIISFEPDPVQYNDCTKISQTKAIRSHTIYNMGLWDEDGELSFLPDGSGGRFTQNGTVKVKIGALDSILQGKKATFIKMDIEGAELRALHGCRNTIVEHRPKLAICVYHKPNDIVEIPLYIHDIAPDYRFYLRHHSRRQFETVLYAIPK